MSNNPDAEKNNPCLKEQQLAYRCLDKNNFDRQVCEVYFLNYKNCKDFWYKIRSERRAKGIYPNLPDIEERGKIKDDYMKTRM